MLVLSPGFTKFKSYDDNYHLRRLPYQNCFWLKIMNTHVQQVNTKYKK